MITSLLCYLTIWNSPADITGTGIADDGAKKNDKGNCGIAVFGFSVIFTQIQIKYMYFVTLIYVFCHYHCI